MMTMTMILTLLKNETSCYYDITLLQLQESPLDRHETSIPDHPQAMKTNADWIRNERIGKKGEFRYF